MDDPDKKDLIIVRPFKEDDYNFIISTWLKGLYYGNDWFEKIDKEAYMTHYHAFINSILSRPNIKVNVSALKEDEDVILGYSILEGPKLHWIYVKEAWRRLGISKDLITHPISTVTHITRLGDQLRPKTIKFNPFL